MVDLRLWEDFLRLAMGNILELGEDGEKLEMNIHPHAREIKMESSLFRTDNLFFNLCRKIV